MKHMLVPGMLAPIFALTAACDTQMTVSSVKTAAAMRDITGSSFSPPPASALAILTTMGCWICTSGGTASPISTSPLFRNLPDTPNMLLHNVGVTDGVPVFEDLTDRAGIAGSLARGLAPETADVEYHVPTWSVHLSDVNEDGWLDILSVQEIPGGVDLFVNNGDGREDICRSNAFFFINLEETFVCLLNESGGDNHWITIRLVGTRSNRFGIGARVEATAGDLALVGEVLTTTSAFTAVHPQVHFGLGQSAKPDTLITVTEE